MFGHGVMDLLLPKQALTFLSLRNNSLMTVPESLRSQLDSVTVDISGNPLTCGCNDIGMVTWIQRQNNLTTISDVETLSCSIEGKHQSIVTVNIDSLKWQCNVSAKVAVGSAASILACLLVLTMYFVYRKRWHIRYRIFKLKERLRKSEPNEPSSFRYDAFILYSSQDEDRLWVHYVLRQVLENEYGFKLCIHHRDFLAGEFIMDNVEEAILTSRKVIAVVSPNFVDSQWCSTEIHAANTVDQNKIIMLLFKDVSNCDTEALLRFLLTKKTYVEWNEQDEKAKQLFWSSVVRALYAK